LPAESPYATHLAVLTEVVDQSMRDVLELGAGAYSTPFFLALPKLKRLVSLETSPEWFAFVKDDFANTKLDLRLVESVPEALADMDLTDFDLVFIDNGVNAEERGAAIRSVLTQPHPLVVIHDAEVYGGLLDQLAPDHTVHRDEEPWTAVVPPMGA
jgi:predicted O-methyltransferase YrrM